MYGLESLLGNVITSIATPAIGGLVGDAAGTALKDVTQNELLKELTQTTMGALSGAAVGAGLGALTGGKSGALGGALSGGVGGGLGGYHAQDIAQMFGMGSGAPQGVGAPQGGQIQAPPPVAMDYNLSSYANKPIPGVGMATAQQVPTIPPTVQQPTAPTSPAPTQPSAFKQYANFLGENKEPLMLGTFGGMSIPTMSQYNQSAENYKRQQQLAGLAANQSARNFARSVYGMADGGPVELGMANPQISVRIPAYAQDEIEREGGLAALQPGLRMDGYANGGYINLQPEPQGGFYPMSQIASARPYPAATPQRTEVLQNYEHGGLLKGQGDGMSDDIPARVSGREEVRVADGEYVIPRHIAQKIGAGKLHKAMKAVRQAAHAKKGQQLEQDAGKRAFIKALTGVHA